MAKEKNDDKKRRKLITPARVSHPTNNKGAHPSILVADIKSSVEKLKYPIVSHEALIKELLASDKERYASRHEEIRKTINNLPIAFFPVKSIDDLERKVGEFVSPVTVLKLQHPTSARPPICNSKKN
jgi:hypothetical protein